MLKISNRKLLKQVLDTLKYSSYSTQPAVKTEQEYDKRIKEFEEISKVTPRVRSKKPQKPPFVKNLMVAQFDTDILTYPELKKDELMQLNKSLEPVINFLQSPDIKGCTSYSKEFRERLSKTKLVGLQVSQLRGGRELTVTETFRYFEEFSKIKLGATIINNEVLMVQALNKFGSDHQKEKYLNKLLSGELTSAFCLLEPTEKEEFNRTAILSEDLKHYVLNGTKKMIINGSSADVFLVVAQTDLEQTKEGCKPKLTVFLIDRDCGGISSNKQEIIFGNHLELSNIIFDNVTIPLDNVLGEVNNGEKVLHGIYPEYRMSTAPICIDIMRNLINNTTEHFINFSINEYPVYKSDAVTIKMADLVTSLYAVESVLYLTTGIMDTYENQDVDMESTITKIFSSDQAVQTSAACLNLIGPEAISKEHWCNLLHNEAISTVLLNDNNDNLKIVLALFGLQYAGVQMNETVMKIRNPLFHASFIFKRLWSKSRDVNDNPRLNMNLHYYLHPSLANAARQLEYCVYRLQYATEIILARHGQEVINQHHDLRRLAECIIDIYAMTATLGRASRSYCIGLQHAQSEIVLANTFCSSAMLRVKNNILDVLGPMYTNDESNRRTSETLFRFKEYFPVHPLSRNF